MDEDIMGKWIEEVLKPYVANPLEDIVLMLVLDEYSRFRCGS